MTIEPILLYVLIGALLAQTIWICWHSKRLVDPALTDARKTVTAIRQDANDSIRLIDGILRDFQDDALEREKQVWGRSRAEVEKAEARYQQVHNSLLKIKMMPRTAQPVAAQAPLPFPGPQNNGAKQAPRRPGVRDGATMGAR